MRRLPHVIPFLLSFLLITVILTSFNAPVSAASSLTLPSGFVDESLYMGLLAPRAFAFLPDGRVLAAERGGQYMGSESTDINLGSLRVFKNGALLPTRAYQMSICGDGERGFLGLAVDPNFATNKYIYVFYTRQSLNGGQVCRYNTFANGDDNGPRNRVSRLTMSGDTVVAGSEKVLIDSIFSDAGVHNAGDLRFGPDGYLYITTANSLISSTSQDTSVLNGKILRILPDSSALGYSTAGNPYNTASGNHTCQNTTIIKANGRPTGPCKEIYAIGFRNPFRFTIQPTMTGIPGTGSPFVGDVGDGTWEEVDQVHSGGNYGYPLREGPCSAGVNCSPPYQNGGFDNPVYAYPHNNQDAAIIGGDFYTGGANYPAAYQNNYFFVEFVRGWVARLVYNSTTGTWSRPSPDFGTGNQSIVMLKRGPDGNLYYLSFLSETDRIDGIHRIRYTGSGNKSPIAQITVNPQGGDLSTVYTFSASGSSDPDNNTPLKYHWDFGDGTTADTTAPTVTTTHTYSAVPPSGKYTASVTVTDSGNPPASSLPATVDVFPGNAAPTGDIQLTNLTDNSRTAPLTYYAGDEWKFQAVNLADDQPLPPNAVTWSIVFHHRDHTHPFLPSVTDTADNRFIIPNTGELDPVVWYRVHLYITDSSGQRTEVYKDVHPITKQLTFMTNPTSGQVLIQGGSYATPYTITRVVGMRFSLDVTSPQTIWNIPWIFNNWSQGGSKSQTLTVPAADTTYTATFTTSPGVSPPRNYFTTSTPTLTWNRISWATHYQVQVAKNALFTDTMTAYPVGNVLSLTLPTALDDGFYYWRVLACSATSCGVYSAADTFVVDAP